MMSVWMTIALLPCADGPAEYLRLPLARGVVVVILPDMLRRDVPVGYRIAVSGSIYGAKGGRSGLGDLDTPGTLLRGKDADHPGELDFVLDQEDWDGLIGLYRALSRIKAQAQSPKTLWSIICPYAVLYIRLRTAPSPAD